VTDQHIAAGETKPCAIFLEASQDSEIALIHQLTAETLHVARASFLFLIGAASVRSAMSGSQSWTFTSVCIRGHFCELAGYAGELRIGTKWNRTCIIDPA
jgi:hypothetical protein